MALRSVLLLAPLVAGVLLGASLADRWGARVGAGLAAVVATLPRTTAGEPEPLEPSEPPDEVASGDTRNASLAEAPAARARRKPSSKPSNIVVAASRVLELAERRVRPSGKSVGAAGSRPAGIALSGVSGLGLGVRDGDVLTEVEGRPVVAASQVIEGVLRARARRSRSISGLLYRGSERFSLVVEQPY